MKYKHIFVISDIHGCLDSLKSLIVNINFNDNTDMLVFLGDYIDRGNDSIACLDFIMRFQKTHKNVIVLKGNHELMMELYFHNNDFDTPINYNHVWIANDGEQTYNDLFSHQYKLEQYLNYISSLPYIYKYDCYVFSHAGINHHKELNKQTEDDCLWGANGFFENYKGKETVVMGNIPTKNVSAYRTIPLFSNNNIVLCDTGSGFSNGRLTCLDLLSYHIFQESKEFSYNIVAKNVNHV